eukprot:scaffold106446_cov63-Phaeocystis_antarctica.AAC.1
MPDSKRVRKYTELQASAARCALNSTPSAQTAKNNIRTVIVPDGRGPRAKKDTAQGPEHSTRARTREYTHRYTLLACGQAFVPSARPTRPGRPAPSPGPAHPA